ncbi:MAG: AAA family ATPase [Candidatus Diapherotrites archaeon]|jgi:tRNA uridine 5-carbamoylmethylation protein Kti12|nr:AAA family ATPase [Candidatus Diapherotrites archaeon]
MKLVVIYGPPATGKLTVANELTKIVDYKLFHNHLTVDLMNSVLEFGTEEYFKLSDKLRLMLLEEAAKQKVTGVIFTWCYGFPDDNAWTKKLINRIERVGGKVCFVQLVCDKQELFKRVKNPSRKKFEKTKSKKSLENCFKKWDLFTPIPFVKNLIIDNTNLSAKKVARKIKSHYKL